MRDHTNVALVAIVHQPDERLAAMTGAHLPALRAQYAAGVAFCSRNTHATILDLLRAHDIEVAVDDAEPNGIYGIGYVRRKAIRAALASGTSHLQMCDFDRALHWVARYPAELKAVIAGIPAYDLLVLGRTDRAWATHPPTQTETEPLFNHVFALVTGLAWDVGAGSRGLSQRAARLLLETSREETVGIDAEWPLLLLKQKDFAVGYRACEGLEFETADRFAAEIAAAGGYHAWEEEISAEPERWVFRLQVALMIAEATVRYGRDGAGPPG